MENRTGRGPDFLIIGAAKSGTTALWQYLRQHPEVFLSRRKHVRHFSFSSENPSFSGPPPNGINVPYAVVDDVEYLNLFAEASGQKALGEASHSYLYQPGSAQRIFDYAPKMRLVVILRQPTERAYSHYRQMIRDGREPVRDFEQALAEEPERLEQGYWPDFHYGSIGLYAEQLSRYTTLFDDSRLKVYLYEDLVSNPQAMLHDLYRFLGVDSDFETSTSVRYNASGLPRNNVLHGVLQVSRRLRPVLEKNLPERYYGRLLEIGSRLHNGNLTKHALGGEVRKRVTERYFAEDILKLEGMIGRNLRAWLD